MHVCMCVEASARDPGSTAGQAVLPKADKYSALRKTHVSEWTEGAATIADVERMSPRGGQLHQRLSK